MRKCNIDTGKFSQAEIDRLNYVAQNFKSRRKELLGKYSPAEKHFEELLKEAHIYYVREKCFFNRKGEWCYIDFYIPLYHIGIEIDGKEHNTVKHKLRDKHKTDFLNYERNVSVIRITNEQCLGLKNISLVDIVRHPSVADSVHWRIESLREHYVDHCLVYVENFILTYKKVYVYDKIKRAIFHFKSAYSFHMSLDCTYKEFVDIMTSIEDPFRNPYYIIGYSEEALSYYMSVYFATNGVRPENFHPTVYLRKKLPVPIFTKYPKRRYKIIVIPSDVKVYNGYECSFVAVRLIDKDNNIKVYDKIYKYVPSKTHRYIAMAYAIKQEAMAIPMNSDLDIITRHGGFRSFIYYGFSEENLDPSVRNEIQTILNGKGISLDIKKVKKYKTQEIDVINYIEGIKSRYEDIYIAPREFFDHILPKTYKNVEKGILDSVYEYLCKTKWRDSARNTISHCVDAKKIIKNAYIKLTQG